MCGIFGFQLTHTITDSDLALGRLARDSLAHRGPDGSGEWFDREKGLYMAHRRLAILDLSEASAQPMVKNGFVLIYNGELYNYIELRRELVNKGIDFKSDGDTEVIIEAWRQWGADALYKFDGMFAFVLWDGNVIHLVTDFFGEKPLFYAKKENCLYFSSDPHILISELSLPFKPDEEDIVSFMAQGFMVAPRTGFQGLYEVPAATHIEIDKSGNIKSRQYWSPPVPQLSKGKVAPLNNQELDGLHEMLHESLGRRLRSDVPIGVFLSSGIDSALVAAMSKKDFHTDITAFTVSFPDGADESEGAMQIARYLDMNHKLINSKESIDWQNAPREIQNIYGVPNDNMTGMSVYQMSALARKYMTVALSGLGGDEIFYGYQRYAFLFDRKNYYKYLSPLLRFGKFFNPTLNRMKAWKLASGYLQGDRSWQYYSLKNNGLGEILDTFEGYKEFRYQEFEDHADLYLSSRHYDMRKTLPGSFIPAMDRGSMRASLEVRTPFLSRKLVEKAASIDQRKFVAFGHKEVLRRILDRYIPRDYIHKGKQGFVFPIARYLSTQHDQVSALSLIPEKTSIKIWSNRNKPEYRSFALRLKILEQFYDDSNDENGLHP